MNILKLNRIVLDKLSFHKFKACFVVTGGGSQSIASLLSIPGASENILEVQIPYSKKALEIYLNQALLTTCNSIISTKLARAAKQRADLICSQKENNIGISCTSALISNRVRKGKNRAHFTLVTNNKLFYKYVIPISLTRSEQEVEISNNLLKFICETISSND